MLFALSSASRASPDIHTKNCTCGNVTRGTCLVSDGISQCTCFDSFHGSDCCTAGGIPAALIGGIAAGVIAAIAIAGAIFIFVVVIASKKAVDWYASPPSSASVD
jgi:hypothetical protein